MFIETSAKTGINIKQLFQNLAQSLPGMDTKGGQGSGATGTVGGAGTTGTPAGVTMKVGGL